MRIIYIGASLLAALTYTFVIWSLGFNQGLDTALCVVTHLETEEPIEQIENCRRVNQNSPFVVLRRNLPESLKGPF